MDHLCDVNTLRVTKYLLTAVFLTFIAGFSKGLKQEVSSTKQVPSKESLIKKKERLRLCDKQRHCIPQVLGMFVVIQTCLNVYAAIIKARTPRLKYVFVPFIKPKKKQRDTTTCLHKTCLIK